MLVAKLCLLVVCVEGEDGGSYQTHVIAQSLDQRDPFS